MPIFSRRRLQRMLDELLPQIGDEKSRDISARLNDKKIEQVLPAEMELALLWALSKLKNFEAEPQWWGGNSWPDAYSEGLINGVPTAIEIAVPNDNSLSGEQVMDRVTQELGAIAEKAKRGVSDYLYYSFAERSGYRDGAYFRNRLAPANYVATENAKALITNWVASGQFQSRRLRIKEADLDVVIEKKSFKQPRYHNTWSSMPPETHSLEDNPLYQLLKRKVRQLQGANLQTKRLIFLGDAGSTLLNRLGTVGERDTLRRRYSGTQIISHFLNSYADKVDGVVVFSPRRGGRMWPGRADLKWAVSVFANVDNGHLRKGLEQIAARLPRPRFEGYQARSLFQQGCFAPSSKAWHLGMTVTARKGAPMQVRFPARLLLDLLAGRISEKQFRGRLEGGDSNNPFKRWLDQGFTISGATMAPRDIDDEDDHLILEFTDDPAAREFRVNPPNEVEPCSSDGGATIE